MILRSILAASAASLFLAPENGGQTGGGVTLEQQLSQSRADLATGLASIAGLTSERDATAQEIASLRAERDTLNAQFTALTESANALRADLTAVQSQLATVSSERDTARHDLTLASANVSRLESLCGVRGIDSTKAVKIETDSNPDSARDNLVLALAAATTPESRGIAAEALRKFDLASRK